MTTSQKAEMSNVNELRERQLRPGRFDLYTRHTTTAPFDGKSIEYDYFQSDTPIDETPIIINNGYCAPAIVYDALAIGLAQNGRNVIRYRPPRSVSIGRMAVGGHLSNPLKKHAQAGWAVMKDSNKKFGLTQFDALGHSMGTPISLMLAEAKPEAVRSVMCTGGAGLDGAGGLFVMSAKGAKLLKDEVIHERDKLRQLGHSKTVGQEVMKHILLHPVDTLAEGYYVSRINSVPNLIRVQQAGVRLGLVIFGKDTFFKPDTVLNHVGNYFDYRLVLPDAKHIHPQIYPFEHSLEQVEAFSHLNAPTHHVDAA